MAYKHKINPNFIKSISKKCIKLTCKIEKTNDKNTIDKIKEFAGTINGAYFNDYYTISQTFTVYLYKPNITKKLKQYKNPQLLSRAKNIGLQNAEEKTLLDYAIQKLKNTQINIIQIENLNWNTLNNKLKEKLILSALKNKNTIRQLIEHTLTQNNTSITTYTQYHLAVTSDENENYHLTIKPYTLLTTKKTIYELLKNNNIVIKNKLLSKQLLITTAIKNKKKKPSKITKIIFPNNPAYYKHVETINNYYQKQGINIKVGGNEKECLILLTNDGYTYHTKNTLPCEIITNRLNPRIKDNTLNSIINTLKQGIILT